MDTSKIKKISKGVVEVRNAGNTVWSGGVIPGPDKLIGGSPQAGFYGEVPTSEFINGDALAKLIGLTAGISQYSNEPWLKFAYMGKVEFIAKKPFRYSISWDNINGVNAVFGNRTVKILEHTYKIRLIKGKTEGKQDDVSDFMGKISQNSEWNRLMLPIHERAPYNWRYPQNVESPTEDWGCDYSDNNLIVYSGEGYWSWCQEYGKTNIGRLTRGNDGVSGASWFHTKSATNSFGWRPVLEFVK